MNQENALLLTVDALVGIISLTTVDFLSVR
jgi:hypothetical protein